MFKSKYFLIGFLFLLIISIPLTLYFVKMQMEVRSRAEATSTLALTTNLTAKDAQGQWIANVGQEFNVDVMVNPGTNAVQTVRFSILFDSVKLQATKITPNTEAFPTTTTEPTISSGSASIEVGVMAGNPSAQIQTTKKVATITFKPLAITGATPTKLVFDPSFTRVTGGQNVAAVNENVLLLPLPELPIVINQGGTPTPTGPTPTGPTPTGTLTPSPTGPTPTGPTPTTSSSTATNQPPVCTALNVDRETAGTAPFSLTFTANGNDPDGIINKVTFDFGDGPVQDIVDGVGTKTISVQVAHTYNNVGTYHATATLTDNSGVLSDSTNCSQTIVVSAATSSESSSTTTTTTQTSTETELTATPTQVAQASATIAATGDITTTLGIIGGILITVIGGFFLLAL